MVLLARTTPLPTIDTAERVLPGIAMTLGAMVIFSVMDGLSKILASDYNPVEIAALRYVCTLLVLTPLVLRDPQVVLRTRMPWPQLGRGLCMTLSSIFFISGLSSLPIADATAIGFVAPLLVTALSIPMLGEKVGIRRWSAVVIGFVGVLVVVQPGTGAFRVAAVYPLLSAATWAMGLVLTRIMRNADGVLTTMVYSTLIGLVTCGLALPFVWRMPDVQGWVLIATMGILSAIGQTLLVSAFNRAPASILAPFSFSQMLWATLIGYFAFAAIPDEATWVGTAIVIASGLYTLHRERIVAQQQAARARTGAAAAVRA